MTREVGVELRHVASTPEDSQPLPRRPPTMGAGLPTHEVGVTLPLARRSDGGAWSRDVLCRRAHHFLPRARTRTRGEPTPSTVKVERGSRGTGAAERTVSLGAEPFR